VSHNDNAYVIINNHTTAGNNPRSRIPGKSVAARLGFKEQILQRLLAVGAASATSRGHKLEKPVGCVVAGDWNLPFTSVEAVMTRRATADWYAVGTNRDFVFSTSPMQEGAQSNPSIAHDKVHQAVLARALPHRIKLVAAADVPASADAKLLLESCASFRTQKAMAEEEQEKQKEIQSAKRKRDAEEQQEQRRQEEQKQREKEAHLLHQERQHQQQRESEGRAQQAEEARQRQEEEARKAEEEWQRQRKEEEERWQRMWDLEDKRKRAEDTDDTEDSESAEHHTNDPDHHHGSEEAPIAFHRSSCRILCSSSSLFSAACR
jgi:hypothetical protein